MDQVYGHSEALDTVRHHSRALTIKRTFWLAFGAIALAYIAATAVRIYVRNYYVFLPDYMRWTVTPSPSAATTHLFVLMTDHFEPNWDIDVTKRWLARYTDMAARHRDADGRMPQHTFFYPAEQYEPGILEQLKRAVADGFGEVEVHFHHDYDNEASLREKLKDGITEFQRYGFLKTTDGRTTFGFIHGNFGLDNSGGDILCGVPTELSLLHELGAYADFTFPAVYTESQPQYVNTLYAAKDGPEPMSYDKRLPLSALNNPGQADLMIFQGPLVFAPTLNVRRLFLDLDDGDIHEAKPASPERIPRWLRANVHVPGHPDWVFIKLFAHGASSQGDMDAVMGPDYDEMLHEFEARYNDGQKYVLHYVTARQAYNLAMAAVDGHSGDPRPFFDYRIPPYLANSPDPASEP
jgi:hypothetical protein